MASATKEQLATSLSEQQKEVALLKDKLRISEAETRRFQNDANRESKNASDNEARLAAIRQVVTATLKVKHGVEVQPQTEWFQGKAVPMEEVNEDIRLLRHIHELSNTQPPF